MQPDGLPAADAALGEDAADHRLTREIDRVLVAAVAEGDAVTVPRTGCSSASGRQILTAVGLIVSRASSDPRPAIADRA